MSAKPEMITTGQPEIAPSQWMPCLHMEIQIGEQTQHYIASARIFYQIISAGIRKQLEMKADIAPEEKRLIQLARTAVRGALLAFGGAVLHMIFKTKDHPKPGKGDDLIEWYSDMFAQLAIGQATGSILVMRSQGGESDGTIIIDEIHTIPLPTVAGGDPEPAA